MAEVRNWKYVARYWRDERGEIEKIRSDIAKDVDKNIQKELKNASHRETWRQMIKVTSIRCQTDLNRIYSWIESRNSRLALFFWRKRELRVGWPGKTMNAIWYAPAIFPAATNAHQLSSQALVVREMDGMFVLKKTRSYKMKRKWRTFSLN
jgi:hypothetical protein